MGDTLRGKVVLVTGANRGIGFGMADGIAEAGADVVVWGRRADRNEAAAERLRRHGRRVAARSVDVTDEAQVAAGIAAIVEELGRLDGVIANAGISTDPGTFLDLTSEQYHELIDVNQHGAYYTVREALRAMVARADAGDPGGSLVACGSIALKLGIPARQHYAASKTALLGLVRGIAVEYGRYGIRANILAPGVIETELAGEDVSRLERMRAIVGARAPLGRTGRPSDVAGAAVYLMSDASAYHTGDVLTVDGGLSVAM